MKKSELEDLAVKGPEAVVLEMASGKHGDPGSPFRGEVDSWLHSKKLSAGIVAAARRDAREEATLSIAKEANRLASEANRFASEANRFASEANRFASEANRLASKSNCFVRAQARWARWAVIIATIAMIIASNELIARLISWISS